MNKFALAALGVVAAHEHHQPHHHSLDFGMEHKVVDSIAHWVFDETEVPAKCVIKASDRMEDFVFFRNVMKGMINSGVKGMYHETTIAQPISEDCFGDWIDTEMDEAVETVSKIADDIWSFKFEDATNVSNKLINMHYKNMDACNI